MTSVSSEGFYRSSSSVSLGSVQSGNLVFASTLLNPMYTNSRGAGLSVRCVQAFTLLAIISLSEETLIFA